MRLYKKIHAWLLAQGFKNYNQKVGSYKQRLLSAIHGNIVEIGSGPGSNLEYYPKDISLVGIEPNIFMHSHFKLNAERAGLKDFVLLEKDAENTGIDPESVDVVVGTLVLCTVDNPNAVLKEVMRILKPGGTYIFIEHVAGQRGSLVRLIQRITRPFWKIIADGCSAERETLNTIKEAGFTNVSHEDFKYGKGIISPHIAGVATK
jgi:ubiquinone/menaquinone biosynthesis C-methylase UbiE